MVEVVQRLYAADGVPVRALELNVLRHDPGLGQHFSHAAHVGADGHAVVVEDYHDGLAADAGVGQALIGKSAGHGPVADYGRHVVALTHHGPRPGHAQRHRHGVGGVAGDKRIVVRLVRLGKAGQAAVLTQGREHVPAPGDYLVGITLVAHVEDQSVLGRVVDPVERHGKLHGAEIGRQVAAGAGNAVDDLPAQLGAQRIQLAFPELFYVVGTVNFIKNFQNDTSDERLLSTYNNKSRSVLQ